MSTSALWEMNPETGDATELSKMDKMLPLKESQPMIVDLNPTVDKLRFMTDTANHHAEVETGAVTESWTVSGLRLVAT